MIGIKVFLFGTVLLALAGIITAVVYESRTTNLKSLLVLRDTALKASLFLIPSGLFWAIFKL